MHVVGGAAATRRVGGHDLEKWRAEGRRRRREDDDDHGQLSRSRQVDVRALHLLVVARVCRTTTIRQFSKRIQQKHNTSDYFFFFFFRLSLLGQR